MADIHETRPVIETFPVDTRFDVRNTVQIDRDALSHRAKMAMDYVARWGAVAAVPDGFDEAGRQKLRQMTEVELVERAVTTTDLLFHRLRAVGWVSDTPQPSDILKESRK